MLTLRVSIDSPNSGSIRDYPNFGSVKENIQELVKIKQCKRLSWPAIWITATLSKQNVGEMADIVKLGSEIGVKHINMHATREWNEKHYKSGFASPSNNTLKQEFIKARKLGAELDVDVRYGYRKYFQPSQGKSICVLPWTRPFISWDGSVSPCCVHLDKKLGNIFKRSFIEIWNGDKYVNFRKKLLAGKEDFCRNCTEGKFWLNDISGTFA